MSNKKIITVFGATGAQGGGLVKAILADTNSAYSVRAVTRDVNSYKAKELAASGAELVAADIDDVGSIKKALTGAYGVYFVTFFWVHLSPEKEYQEVVNFIVAAKESNLQHIIGSTMEDSRDWLPLEDNRMPTLQGKYKVPSFDGKGSADKLFAEAGLPITCMRVCFYYENFISLRIGPKKFEDGKYYMTIPMGNKKLPCIAVEDIGKCAYGIFKKGDSLIGKTVGIAGEKKTVPELTAEISKATGIDISFNDVTPDVFRSYGFPGADEVGNMFQFKADFNDVYCGHRSIDFANEVNSELQGFDKWLSMNASRIPLN
jgi:uncharacterized protein YbjT (DUF2867 family)